MATVASRKANAADTDELAYVFHWPFTLRI